MTTRATDALTGPVIRRERVGDTDMVREVVARAFGPGEPVPELVDRLRDSDAGRDGLSFVAVAGEDVVGHVMLTRSRLDAPRRLVDVLVLSPLSVAPERQAAGIGTALVRHAIAQAEVTAFPLIFLEGSPRYYGRRGFEPAGPLGFRRPSLRIPEPAFQVRRLPSHQPWMTGTLVYPDVFWELDCVGLRDADA